MARTLDQMQTELVIRIGDDTIDTSTSAGWINASWQECLEYYTWPFRKGSASGTLASSTALQTFSSIFSVTDFKRMVKLTVAGTEYDRIDYEDKDDSGWANKYAIDPQLTGVYLPGADGGSTVMKYLRHVPDLTSGNTLLTPDGTANGVPTPYITPFEEAIIAGAATRYFQNALKFGSADYWQSQRNFYLDQVIDQYTNLSTADAPAIRTIDFNDGGDRAF